MYQVEGPACCLADWVERHCDHPEIAAAIVRFSEAATRVARLVTLGPLAIMIDGVAGASTPGDARRQLVLKANQLFVDALHDAPVATLVADEHGAIAAPNHNAPLVVTIDPLEGSTDIDVNMPIGTIMAILPNPDGNPAAAVLQPGTAQLAAGFVVYGPQTTFVLTHGPHTHIFTLDHCTGDFLLTRANVRIPARHPQYAINASNYRHWDVPVRAYIDDCVAGLEGPQGKNFDMFWTTSLVAEALRICVRGGISLHPRDCRPGYRDGHLNLVRQANPVARLIEKAGGMATDGVHRILDIVPQSIHQRVPLIFGSRDHVDDVARYHADRHSIAERWPLFGHRGLFKV